MRINGIKLLNFRSYIEQEIELSPNINIFIGENGTGKTNILEAIYVLSLTKSCRNGTDFDLINNSKNNYQIEGKVEYDGYTKIYKICFDKIIKKVFINNNQIKKISDYIGNFCVVSFFPNDIDIIKGSPNIRRSVLNIQIGILNNNYLNYLNEYNSVLKIRNEYLKRLNINGFSDLKYLYVINSKMIDISLKIYKLRYSYIDEINNILPDIFKKISGISNIKVIYQNSFGIYSYDEENLRLAIKEKYKNNLNKEIMQGMTIFGVHRDDITFLVNDMDAKIYCSEGQQRLVVISYKIAELFIFKKIKKENPVLLLDDVFSEIDIKKRNRIVKYLKKDIQVIITTTDINDIEKDLVDNAKIFNIKNNNIKIKGGAKCKKKKF